MYLNKNPTGRETEALPINSKSSTPTIPTHWRASSAPTQTSTRPDQFAAPDDDEEFPSIDQSEKEEDFLFFPHDKIVEEEEKEESFTTKLAKKHVFKSTSLDLNPDHAKNISFKEIYDEEHGLAKSFKPGPATAKPYIQPFQRQTQNEIS